MQILRSNAPGGSQLGINRGESHLVAAKDPENDHSQQYQCQHANLDGGDGENIADEIFYNLDEDKISFLNPVYQKILDTYREQWKQLGVGVKVPERHFINHIDPDVCNMSVDILTSDDNLVPSKLWQQKDVHIESEVEMLSNGVPKAIMLYRSKIIERLIKELTQRLDDSDLSDDDQIDIVRRLDELNNAKTAISRQSQRLIL